MKNKLHINLIEFTKREDRMAELSPKIIAYYYDQIASFERWANTYMRRNDKKMLLTILSNFQQIATKFSKDYSDSVATSTGKSYTEWDKVSYDIYLAAVPVRQFIDGYHNMTDEQQDEWHRKYNVMNETDGIDMTGNKWVNTAEIYFIQGY